MDYGVDYVDYEMLWTKQTRKKKFTHIFEPEKKITCKAEMRFEFFFFFLFYIH